jgi:hypothetical protein
MPFAVFQIEILSGLQPVWEEQHGDIINSTHEKVNSERMDHPRWSF